VTTKLRERHWLLQAIVGPDRHDSPPRQSSAASGSNAPPGALDATAGGSIAGWLFKADCPVHPDGSQRAHVPATNQIALIAVSCVTAGGTGKLPSCHQSAAEAEVRSPLVEISPEMQAEPQTATFRTGQTLQLSATALDQFRNPLEPQPPIAWAADYNGSVTASGLYTAGPELGGPFSVYASASRYDDGYQISYADRAQAQRLGASIASLTRT
jgi:hypothetical protein